MASLPGRKSDVVNALRSFLNNFKSNTGLRGPILKLLSGTGYASLAGYLGMLVLVRLYPKESWAVNDYIISLVGVFGPLVSLRYEDALMLAEDKRNASHAFFLACFSTIIISTLLWILLPIAESVGALTKIPQVTEWLWVVPVLLVIFRISKIAELWLIRLEDFDLVPIGQITQMSTMVVTRIGYGLLGSGPAGLISGYAIGWIASIMVFGKRVGNSLADALGDGLSFKILRDTAIRYRRFPAYTAPAAMISALGTRLPILVLAIYFSLETVGEYGRAVNLLFVPLSFVGVAIGQVFFVRAVQAHRHHRLYDISATIHERMVMLAILPAAVMMVGGPGIFAFLLGEDWRASGEMIRYLAPWIFLTSVSSPLTRLFDVMERQRLELILNLIIFGVLAAALIIGGATQSLTTTLLMLGIGGAVVRFIQLTIILRLADVDLAQIVWPYLRYGFFCLPWLVIVGVASAWFSPFLTTLCSIIAGAGYLATVIIRDNYFTDE